MANRSRDQSLLAQRRAIVQFGRFALRSDDLTEILTEACRLTGEALGTDLAKIMELQDHGRTLLVVSGVGWDDGVVGEEKVPALQQSSEGYALKTGVPAVSEDLESEERFDYAEFLKRHGVKALVNVVIPGPDGHPSYGLLQVDSRKPRKFDKSDIEFLQGYANVVGAAIERFRYQRELQEALRLQKRLFAELQHRVKNNLAVVESLLRLKSRRAEHPVAKQEITEVLSQVGVLREIYQQLHSSSDIEQVDLGGYLSSLSTKLASFGAEASGERPQIEVTAEAFSVNSDIAIPLGLVASEFITNSLKHSSMNGGLKLSVSVAKGDGQLLIELADDGPGIGDALEHREDAHTGSGLGLIEGLLNQINAEHEWSSKQGTTLRVRIPIDAHHVHVPAE